MWSSKSIEKLVKLGIFNIAGNLGHMLDIGVQKHVAP